MALKIGDNFKYQGKQPNFDRDTFATLDEMKAFPETSIDEGHESYCLATGKRYKFSSSNTIDATLGKWRLTVDTALNASSENPVQNKVITNKINTSEATVIAAMSALQTSVDTKLKTTTEKLERDVADTVSGLTGKVDAQEIVTVAALGEIRETIKDNEESISAAINHLNDTKVSTTMLINGKEIGSGEFDITKADIGLENVDNTSDLNKPVSTATQKALDGKVNLKQGYDLISETLITKLTALPTASKYASDLDNIRAHSNQTDNPHGVTADQVGLGDFVGYTPATLPVSSDIQTSLDGKVDNTITINNHPLTGNVTVTKADIGLNNVNNTSDENKPVSTAQQAALNLKVDKTLRIAGHELSSDVTLEPGDVGLGNVDNTADLDKPLSNPVKEILEESEYITSKALTDIVTMIGDNEESMAGVINLLMNRILHLERILVEHNIITVADLEGNINNTAEEGGSV